MTITIKPSHQITTVDGVRARVWHGRDDQGRACILFVSRLAYPEGEGEVKELIEIPPPVELVDVDSALRAHSLRQII
jgi:hypothetical protein